MPFSSRNFKTSFPFLTWAATMAGLPPIAVSSAGKRVRALPTYFETSS
jgi:hypothetical protein